MLARLPPTPPQGCVAGVPLFFHPTLLPLGFSFLQRLQKLKLHLPACLANRAMDMIQEVQIRWGWERAEFGTGLRAQRGGRRVHLFIYLLGVLSLEVEAPGLRSLLILGLLLDAKEAAPLVG